MPATVRDSSRRTWTRYGRNPPGCWVGSDSCRSHASVASQQFIGIRPVLWSRNFSSGGQRGWPEAAVLVEPGLQPRAEQVESAAAPDTCGAESATLAPAVVVAF